MLRKINNVAIIEELKNNVIPNMNNHNINEIAKYALTLKLFIDMDDFKKLGSYVGMTIGATTFFACSATIPVAAGATMAIASFIKFIGVSKQSLTYKKIFVELLKKLEVTHKPTPEELSSILRDIEAEDIVSFLEFKGFIKEEE